MTPDGQRLGTTRIDNDPFELAEQVSLWGESPEVVLHAAYGWYWAADVLADAGAVVDLAHPLGVKGSRTGGSGTTSVMPLIWLICCGWADCRRRGSPRPRSAAYGRRSVIGLYKAELVRRHGPWRSLEHLELSTLEWVDWYNQRRLHSWCGNIPPAEYEAIYYTQPQDPAHGVGTQPS